MFTLSVQFMAAFVCLTAAFPMTANGFIQIHLRFLDLVLASFASIRRLRYRGGREKHCGAQGDGGKAGSSFLYEVHQI
jgi:hypothetical protein